jgi:hypothetical protein
MGRTFVVLLAWTAGWFLVGFLAQRAGFYRHARCDGRR